MAPRKPHTTSSGTNFLDLPAELRNRINEYVFSTDTPERKRRTKLIVSPTGFEVPGLLRTNHQIRSETRAMFFSNHVFVIPRVDQSRLQAKFRDVIADLEQSTIRVEFDTTSSGMGMGCGKSCFPWSLYDFAMIRPEPERDEDAERKVMHLRNLCLIEQRIQELELEVKMQSRRPARRQGSKSQH